MWNVTVMEVFPVYSISKNNKKITMAQFENGLWKESFVNWAQ